MAWITTRDIGRRLSRCHNLAVRLVAGRYQYLVGNHHHFIGEGHESHRNHHDMRDGGVPSIRSSPWEVVVTSSEFTQFIREVHRIGGTGNGERPVTHFAIPGDVVAVFQRRSPDSYLTRDYLEECVLHGVGKISLRTYAEMGVVYDMLLNAHASDDEYPLHLPRQLAHALSSCALHPAAAMRASELLDGMFFVGVG